MFEHCNIKCDIIVRNMYGIIGDNYHYPMAIVDNQSRLVDDYHYATIP